MNFSRNQCVHARTESITSWLRILYIFVSLNFSSLACADRTIVILRHGEKPEQGLGQLSCTGLNRALALPPLLLQRYGQPIALYAPNPSIKKNDKGVAYAYIRPLATIEPFAIASGLPVIIDYGMTDIESLARNVLAKGEGTQVIAWEHHWAETLTRELLSQLGKDANTVPKWEDSDFDSLFVIRTAKDKKGGETIVFSREMQNLKNLSNRCPTPNSPSIK